MHALRWVVHPKVMWLLVKALLTDADADVRKHAVRSLWFQGQKTRATLPLLERALRFDPHSDMRRQTAYHIAVWQTDAPALTEILFSARAAETDPDVVESLDDFTHHDADAKAAAIAAGNGPPGMMMAP